MTEQPPAEPPQSDTELSPRERALSEQLEAQRPVPAAGFRGALGRYLVREDPGYGPRPNGLRAQSAGLVLAGAVVLVVGALQATGAL